jgi:predicted signal transduction protein with EAL and GGDEF domain
VFHRNLYDDMWSFVDQNDRESQVGQISVQLFDSPNPRRVWNSELRVAVNVTPVRLAYTGSTLELFCILSERSAIQCIAAGDIDAEGINSTLPPGDGRGK